MKLGILMITWTCGVSLLLFRNWFDIENILKEPGFSIKDIPFCFEGRIIRIMRRFKLPKALQSFYLKITATCIIVGEKIK